MTDAELTILSLLAEQSRYGHEIQNLIDERGLREWLAVGFSSVFHILNKLEEQHFVQSELQAMKAGAARKRYTLTDAGRGVLQTAIAELLRSPRSLGSGFELGLANLHVLKPQQVYHVLTAHLDDLKRQRTATQQSWERYQAEDNDDTMEHIRALYTHSLAMMDAEIQWMTDFLTDWVARYPDANKPPTKPNRDAADSDSHTHTAEAQLNRRITPDPLKMIQRLKRPKPTDDESDS